jgi:uncharacterized membrane protein YeaQ/YmgE (transglycosylase-associated protein family)
MASKKLNEMSLAELEARKMTLRTQNAMIATAGLVGGLAMAYKQGGGLFKYAVYGLGNAIVLGFLPRLFYFVPKENEVDALIADRIASSSEE